MIKDLKDVRELLMFKGEKFQAGGTESAKALRLKFA